MTIDRMRKYTSILKTNIVEKASLEFRLRTIDETRNYLLDKIKDNDLMSERKKTCKYLNYVEHLLILPSTVTGCASISTYASLVCIPVDIRSSTVGLNILTIIAKIKMYKSIVKKKKTKDDKIVLLWKDKLNTIEALIYKVLIDSFISHDEFVLEKRAF